MDRVVTGTADVIIFGGQSNMQGQTERLSENAVVEGAFEYRFLDDALVPLKNPVGEDIRFDGSRGWPIMKDEEAPEWLRDNVLGSACYGHTNMVPAFCRAYIKETETQVVAVHAARGSTVVGQWLPGTPGFDLLTRKCSAAIRKTAAEGLNVGRIFFLWLQGESDAIDGRTEKDYEDSLVKLDEALKNALGIEKFCIIRVGYFTNDARDEAVMSAQDKVCLDRPEDFIMLTRLASEVSKAADKERYGDYMHPFIGGHFSAYGLEQIGSEAGKALGRFAAGAKE
jgi:hypothetical protein